MRANRTSKEQGFSLLEVLVALTFLTLIFLASGLTVQSSSLVARQMEEDLLIQTQAQNYVDLCLLQPFGRETDDNPLPDLLVEVFDNDEEPGDITLHQLTRWPVSDDGWRFELTSFPVPGEWRVSVTSDLDGDGGTGTTTATGNDATSLASVEASRGVFRISVFFNERPILTTNRAKEVSL